MGRVIAVCSSPTKGTRKQKIEVGTFIEDFGIEGDAHAGKWHRQVSLLSYEKIEAFRLEGAAVEEGAFGENLVVEGIDFKILPVGTRLFCNGVILEVTQIGKECHHGCQIYQEMGDCIMPREGVFARVIRGGSIKAGDNMEIHNPEEMKPLEETGGADEKLGTAPLGKLMAGMAVPAVAAQLINVLYNIVDRIYIGHIEGYGDVALTGVGVTFPIITLISAFSAFAGMGGAPLASIQLGKRDHEKAERILGNSAGLLIIFAVVLTVVFSLFKTPILYAFGASDQTIGYAGSYIAIYLVGTIFVQIAVGLNTFISGQGQPKTAMLSVLIGAVINIALDPVLIFGFHMGVRGAALATIISQAVSAIWVLRFLISRKSVMRLKPKNMRLKRDIVGHIASLGISPFIMQSTESLVSITLNSGLQRYGGDLYVGTMSIMTSVMQLIVIPVQGVTQGIQPIISYNYGAGNKKRVKGAFSRMVIVCLAGTLFFGGAAVVFPEVYAGLFTNNDKLAALTCEVMPVYFFGITIFGIQAACQATFLSLGQAKVSLFIALLRKVILLIPLAIILPRFMGVIGIYRAEPIADILSVLATSALFAFTFKNILRNMGKSGMIGAGNKKEG